MLIDVEDDGELGTAKVDRDGKGKRESRDSEEYLERFDEGKRGKYSLL